MNFFKKMFSSTQPDKQNIVFIVEDNAAYAKVIENFIKTNFSSIDEVKKFPVGETCLMELDRNPDVIIMDYYLDSKYEDAETGLETVKKIRAQNPNVNIIVLSAQKDLDITLEAVSKYHCTYIKKD